LGKTAGKDEAAHKATYVALYGIEAARQRAAELCHEAIAAVQNLERDTTQLEAIARFIIERKN
jgi:geranylgeranyl pyrophosphate synthase